MEQSLLSRRFGSYTIQAAISAVHSEASTPGATDWGEIVGLYDALMRTDPSPVVELNRSVAVAMRDGPAAGLAIIDAILERGDLVDYRLAHAARADLCRRLGRVADARRSYERAIALTQQEPERRFLERQLADLGTLAPSAAAITKDVCESGRDMKYLCLVYLEKEKLRAVPDSECMTCGDGFRKSGLLVAAEALQPVETAATVRIRGGKVSVTDGPFAETKEQLAGFYLLDARDLNEAIQMAAKIPPAREGSVEVRPVRELNP